MNQLRNARTALAQASPGAARSLALAFVNRRLGDSEGADAAWKEFGRSAPQVRPAGLLEQGREDFYRHRFDSAAVELKQWLKSNPADLSAAYLLVRTERALSLSLLGQLLSTAPDSIPAHQLMAETEENAENYEKAAAEYRWIEQRNPELPGIHYALGRMLIKTGDRDGATAEFTAELRLDPNHPGANAELGAILVDEEKPQQGIVFLERALRFDPDLWAAHRELGRALLMEKNYTRAEAELQKATADDPDGLAYYQLGILYRTQGRTDLANKMFRRTRQLKADRLAEQNNTHTQSEVQQP
jgi:tetratricopeptide (TPR) repeat protein